MLTGVEYVVQCVMCDYVCLLLVVFVYVSVSVNGLDGLYVGRYLGYK